MQHTLITINVYLGPELPITEEDQFTTVVMATAGYIPEYGIKFRAAKPRINRINDRLRHRLQASGEVKLGASDAVRGFLKSYILNQPLCELNISNFALEEFIETENLMRRRQIGHTLLALYTDRATEGLSETYYQAYRHRLILPGLPNNVQRFTKSRLGSIRMRDRLVNELHKQLTLV